MNKTLQLTNRAKAVKAELDSIAARAESDGRNFTANESARVEKLLTESKSLKAQIVEAKGDDELRDSVRQLGDDIGLPYGSASSRGTKDTSRWADAFMKAMPTTTHGVKELTPSGSVTLPALSSTIALAVDRPRRLLELIPRESLGGTNTFRYLRETVRTQNAAPVAPGAVKPTSVYSLVPVEDTAKTIAHLTEPIERQTLDDATMLRSYIDQALRAGVELAVEAQIIDGDGTGENFTGLTNTSGVQVQAFATDLHTTTRKAVTKLESVAEIEEGTFVFHPDDWETIDLLQDNEARYYHGGPVDRTRRQLHGHPVVTSTVATVGVGHLVDFAGSTQLWEREAVRVDWSENMYDPDALGAGVGASDFARNLVRFRGEGRWGFAVLRPRGVVQIDLTAV